MIVFSLLISTRPAIPKCSAVVFSSVRPSSSAITCPPVKIAKSSNMALRRSPKPGALIAQVLTVPRMLFTINVASASPSTSSATINRGLPALLTASSTGIISRMFVIFLSNNRTNGLSNSTVCFSWLLIKYGLK